MLTKNKNTWDGQDRQNLIDYLFTGKCSCVIRNGNEIRVFRERGVKDLYRLLKEEPAFLHGAFVADKVVGKAAAALMILGGVKEIFAEVISQPASKLFSRATVHAEYFLMVPYIINRSQTDWCPLERGCANAVSAEECLPIIENFIADISKCKDGKQQND